MSVRTLLVATRNPGKMREYRELLADYPGRLISLDAAGVRDEVDETGDTFHANAILKASSYAQLSGHLTISDDSGLEVHALEGAPGVYSARYGGDACHTDDDRVALLLRNMSELPWERRIARFFCCTAIADPEAAAQTFTVVGSIAGVIQYEPVGEHGFGYDPVFYLPTLRRSMAELALQSKNAISHRADAARKARRILASL